VSAKTKSSEKEVKGRQQLVGAPGDVKAIDDETHKFVVSLRNDVEHLAGYNFTEFKPVSFKTQVVSGLNYFVKIHVGSEHYIHVTIWKKVGGQPPAVTHVSPGKSANDPL